MQQYTPSPYYLSALQHTVLSKTATIPSSHTEEVFQSSATVQNSVYYQFKKLTVC